MKVEIRPLRRSDLEHFTTFGKTTRGYVITEDGKPIAIGGVLHTNLNQAFSELKKEADKYPIMKMKLGKKVRGLFEKYTDPVYAIASETIESSERFLEHLGFEFVETNEYGRLYVWHKQASG